MADDNKVKEIEQKAKEFHEYCERIKWYNAVARIPKALVMASELIILVASELSTVLTAISAVKSLIK